ncbi:MAG: amidase domain-containing protein [Candidatus Weimeria sp.]
MLNKTKKLIGVIIGVIAFAGQAYSQTDILAAENSHEKIQITELKSLDKSSISGNERFGYKSPVMDRIIEVDWIRLDLCPQFVDQEQAASEIKSRCPDVIAVLQKKYGLGDFSDSTWKDYRVKQMEYLDCPDRVSWYSEDNDQFVDLDGFFDIYENQEYNDTIIKKISQMGSERELMKDEDLLLQLPSKSYNKFVAELSERVHSTVPERQLKISNNAISYAEKYATSPNKKQFGYISGSDCTNFASQIMLAGGKTITPS